MNTESIVYLLRKTSLTRSEIGQLTPSQFNEILREVFYQESVEEYQKQHAIACLLAAIYNTIPRKSGKGLTAKDFLKSDMPERNQSQKSLESLAEKHNIKLPTKEIKNR